jgi:hypothetical protein
MLIPLAPLSTAPAWKIMSDTLIDANGQAVTVALSERSPHGNWKIPSVPRLSGSGLGLSRISGNNVTRLIRRGGWRGGLACCWTWVSTTWVSTWDVDCHSPFSEVAGVDPGFSHSLELSITRGFKSFLTGPRFDAPGISSARISLTGLEAGVQSDNVVVLVTTSTEAVGHHRCVAALAGVLWVWPIKASRSSSYSLSSSVSGGVGVPNGAVNLG